jgi:hypothetical protein
VEEYADVANKVMVFAAVCQDLDRAVCQVLINEYSMNNTNV